MGANLLQLQHQNVNSFAPTVLATDYCRQISASKNGMCVTVHKYLNMCYIPSALEQTSLSSVFSHDKMEKYQLISDRCTLKTPSGSYWACIITETHKTSDVFLMIMKPWSFTHKVWIIIIYVLSMWCYLISPQASSTPVNEAWFTQWFSYENTPTVVFP